MTRDELRARHPHLSESGLDELKELLARNPQSIREIWESENVMPDVPLEEGPDGLTRSMRELNEFAEKRGMPIPFKAGRWGPKSD